MISLESHAAVNATLLFDLRTSETAMFGRGNTLTIGFDDGSEVVLKNLLDSYMESENKMENITSFNTFLLEKQKVRK